MMIICIIHKLLRSFLCRSWGHHLCYLGDHALRNEIPRFIQEKPGRNLVTWQPVHHASDPDAILYHEARIASKTVHDQNRDDNKLLPSQGRKSSDPAGVNIAMHALKLLEERPLVSAGVPTHGPCISCTKTWSGVEAVLMKAPSIARRLIFQIDEARLSVPVAHAEHFATRMRHYGCRIAITGFGKAGSSIAALVALRPDIVRIDGFFVRYGLITGTGRALLPHLVALASTISRDVAIEGVETSDGARMAADAGALWQQGSLYGSPTVIHPSAP